MHPMLLARSLVAVLVAVMLTLRKRLDSKAVHPSDQIAVKRKDRIRIVRMAAPYGAFPPEIRKDTDLLVITRTWVFTQGDRIRTE